MLEAFGMMAAHFLKMRTGLEKQNAWVSKTKCLCRPYLPSDLLQLVNAKGLTRILLGSDIAYGLLV